MPQGEVYVDLYFFVNASMDLLCLNLTALLLHSKPKAWRLLLGAALGGLYAIAVLLLGIGGVWELLLDGFGACVICAAVFARRAGRFSRAVRTVGVFLLISVLLGGVMTALFWALNRLNLPIDALTEDHISVWLFAVLALVSGILTRKGGAAIGRANKAKSVAVEAVLFGKKVEFQALVDTGNLLTEPISGRPVILVEPKTLRGVLPHGFFLPPGDPVRLQMENDHQTAKRVRLIPSASVLGTELLTAVLPDEIWITDDDGKRQTNHLIALASNQDRALGFDALIGA
ncbi:MAG: hypothetical protein E7680_04560 [Ruminococcaceae bacterium]|nr:hypothetical protein [Oscillospiraceae bacterium]